MRCALAVVALVLALAAPAAAEDLSDAYRIEVPEAFEPQPRLGESLAATAATSHQLGDLPIDTGAKAWARPGHGALYVTWVAAREPSPEPEAAIRSAFDRVRESPVAASPRAGSTREVAYAEGADDDVAVATLEWHHLSNETVSLTRALAWASPEGAVRLVKAECVHSVADTAARPACEAALASLALEVPAAERRTLGELGASTPPARPSVTAGAGELGETAAGPSIAPPPAASDQVLYRGPGGAESGGSSARTWIVIGGALLAVAAWLWWRGRKQGAGGASDAEPEPDADDSDSDSDAEPDGDEPAGRNGEHEDEPKGDA